MLILLQLQKKIEKYYITLKNIYNFDEKDFLIGLSKIFKRIVTIEHLKGKKILGTSQDNNREFISLIACICANSTFLSPALIYKGENNELRDTWLKDFDYLNERAYFTNSSKGWSNENIGLQWLTQVFELNTKEKAGRSRRILIIDGHNSHLNLAFIDFCDRHRIISIFLLPHSTHRFQPLDVSLFSPLANYYTQEIDRLMTDGQGLDSMSKRFFWKNFRAAWNKAFSEANITENFAVSGI